MNSDMEKEQLNLLIETHGSLKRLEGLLNGERGISHQVSRNSENVEHIKKNMVTDDKCHERIRGMQTRQKEEVKSAVVEAMNGKKRSKWILLKDILLGLFSAGGIGTIILLALLGKL